MLRNYLMIAWRQIVKNKVYAGINTLGLVVGLLVFVAVVYVMVNLLVDLLQAWIDPRIRLS